MELKIIRKIGYNKFNFHQYHLCNDGNVWACGVKWNKRSNHGEYNQFLENVANHKYRGIIITEEEQNGKGN